MRIILLMAASAMLLPAESKKLCGRPYATSSELKRDLIKDRNILKFPKGQGIETLYDREAMILWWFSTNRYGNVIATCKRKLLTDKGYVDVSVEADCNGDRTGMCVAQSQRMTRAKF